MLKEFVAQKHIHGCEETANFLGDVFTSLVLTA